MTDSINNGIPFVPENTIDPAAGLNESIKIIDRLLQLKVLGLKQNTPAVSPSYGDRYIVGPSPTGAWAGHELELAEWVDGDVWEFSAAHVTVYGTSVYINTGTDWIAATAGGAPAWGEIVGDIEDQTDLIAQFATAAQGSAADTAVQPGDLAQVAFSGQYADLDGLPTLGSAAAAEAGDFATAAQGELADSAVQPADITDVVRDDDARLTDSRAPTGGAGGVLSGSYPNPGFAVDMATQAELDSGLAGKVDKVAGKQLSTEDYTTAEKSKLDGIAAGAQVNAVTSVAGKTGAVTLVKGDVGLGNVDNTSDATKSIGGNAATATKLQTARTIGGVSFDGTANIDLPGVNTPGNQDTTGTAADSSKLGGQLPSYYATAAQVGDIDAALDLINGEVI